MAAPSASRHAHFTFGPFRCIAVSLDARWAVVGGTGSALVVYDLHKVTQTVTNPSRILPLSPTFGPTNALAFSADGSLVAAGFGNGQTCLFDTADLDPDRLMTFRPLPGGVAAVTSLAFNSAGPPEWLAVGDDSGRTRVLPVTGGDDLYRSEGAGLVSAVSLSPNGQQTVVARHQPLGADSSVCLTGPDGVIDRVEAGPGVLCMALSRHGRYALAGRVDGFSYWDLVDKRNDVRATRQPVFCACFSPDGEVFALADGDCGMNLYSRRLLLSISDVGKTPETVVGMGMAEQELIMVSLTAPGGFTCHRLSIFEALVPAP